MKTIKLKITGKVQGVFYRANSRDQANKLGLSGYAKNMSDGSVEVLLQGEDKKIQEFIKWAKNGSEMANVENVEVMELEKTEFIEGFSTY